MIFYFEKDGRKEPVQLEAWVWLANYSDKTQLAQFEVSAGQGKFHRIAEIDHEKIAEFTMINSKTGQSISIIIPKGAKIIHKYRNDVFISAGKQLRFRTYVAGYEKDGRYFMNFILPDGNIVQADDPDAVIEIKPGR